MGTLRAIEDVLRLPAEVNRIDPAGKESSELVIGRKRQRGFPGELGSSGCPLPEKPLSECKALDARAKPPT